MMRRLSILLVLALVGALPNAARATCVERTLVLSAFPGEIDPLLTRAQVDRTLTDDGRTFYEATLAGEPVVLALSGIGRVNAARTTERALALFRCGDATAITSIVFSGVAGGPSIGDVAIPSRWTADDGTTWHAVDAQMLSRAASLAHSVELARAVPTGDPACAGVDPTLVTTVTVPHEPRVVIGGSGKTTDPFGGRAFPCWPGGGDVFGCRPCRAPGAEVPDVARFAQGMLPFADPSFFIDFFRSPPPAGTTYAAEDMESGAVAAVASANGIPFIAFRGVSDGAGDPLMLPGFPFQFFYYRQLAAENAARVTLAFLAA